MTVNKQTRRLIARGKFEAARLTTTNSYAQLWAQLVADGQLEIVLEEFERVVMASARDEWGANTHCKFHRDMRQIEVEHFDGRQQLLESKVQLIRREEE